jgi:hypothetical protein
MPTHQQLLDQQAEIGAKLGTGSERKVVEAVKAIAAQNFGPGIQGAHPRDINFSDADDPFGGNVNNRKVAERIAGQSRIAFTNLSKPIHTGDPQKARRDIERSKTFTPDPVEETEDVEVAEPILLRPSADSPAAKRVDAPLGPPTVSVVAPVAPPTWKPNA